jgi:5'-nucleotidase
MEGRFLGLPAIAVSLARAGEHHDGNGHHFDSGARAVSLLMRRLLVDPLPADTILNVNVPDRPWGEIEGFEVTRLGSRHRASPCIAQRDPRGRTVWWIGAAGDADDAGPGTDFDAVRRGFVSVTPIHVDLTRFQALEKVSRWIGGLTAQLQGEQAA